MLEREVIPMLISFRFANFRSFKDETIFTMETDKIRDLKDLDTFERCNAELLKCAIIYGRNASGKSNLFMAFSKMREIVLRSTEEEPKYRLEVDHFLLNEKNHETPVLFELEFIIDDTTYKYGFEILNEEVHSEWLYRKEQRYVNVFTRTSPDKESINISKKYEDGWKKYADMTRRNTLFISRMANLACDFAIKLRNYFFDFYIVTSDNLNDSDASTYVTQRKENKESVVSFLRKAHVDIEDIKANPVSLRMPEILKKEIFSMISKDHSETDTNKFDTIVHEIKTIHGVYNENNERTASVEFDLSKESKGTQKLFAFAKPIIETLRKGGILLIDEFDTKLHPELTEYIVSLFNSINNNSKNAQLIAITHNPLLMDSKYIRRDQIWITDKDKCGASDLYRLTDFNIRKDKKLMKSYLLGQFGSVPDIDKDGVF